MESTAARQTTATAVATAPQVSGRRWSVVPYLFILPHMVLFAVFLAYPFISGLLISFQDYDYLRPERTQFIGLDNYRNLFTPGVPQFEAFWNGLGNTVKFVIMSVPFLVVIPLLLAVLLNTKTPGRTIFRAIYFAPWVLSVAVSGLLWWWIFQSQGGLMNYYLHALGFEAPKWLSTLPWGWIAILICTVWWTMGFNMIILLAALQDIPDSLYEAAAIDGASPIQMFFRITVPLLQPVILFIITTSIIASFNLFGQPFIMTRGGPGLPNGGGGTETVMMRIYDEGFARYRQGSAAAMSFVVAAIMVAVSFVNFRLFRQQD